MSARLYQLAGLLKPPDAVFGREGSVVDVELEAWDQLVAEATLMLRGGVSLSPEWWGAQGPVERMALVHAGDRLAARRAFAAGAASHGSRGAAAVLSAADGGAAMVRIELEEAAARVAAEARR